MIPPRQAVARGRSGLMIAGGALASFAVLFALVRTNRSAATDAAITLRFQRHRRPFVARAMAIVSWPGFPPQSRLIPPALAASLWLLGLRIEAVFQALAWGTSGISFFFKSIMRRPRPDRSEFRVAIARIGGSSFPSGHVLNYMGIYGFLAYLAHTLVRPKAPRRMIVSGLVTLLALVGPSRVYLGHHWFTDVLASYLLGTSYLIGVTAIYRRVKAWLA
ncbi:MAG TPA: phosphatase PAP2 family protein [Thermomicrobiales bacterium]|nr:phosphatase PAP2 family protein [Thermomicrobiales bacterium]